jgi:hypothetical protein
MNLAIGSSLTRQSTAYFDREFATQNRTNANGPCKTEHFASADPGNNLYLEVELST